MQAPLPAHDVVTWQDCSQMPIETPTSTEHREEPEQQRAELGADLSDRETESGWMLKDPIVVSEVPAATHE